MTTTGNVGIIFDVEEFDDTPETGAIVQTFRPEAAISEITVQTDDVPVSAFGAVGTTAFTIDLTNLVDDSGTGYTITFEKTGVSFSLVKSLVIHNRDVANNLVITAPVSNPYFSSGDQITIPPEAAIKIPYPTPEAVNGSKNSIQIVGSGADTDFHIFALGRA